MGDIADDCTERGLDEIEAHNSGMCDLHCRLCEELERKARAARNRRARRGADQP